MKYSPAMLGKKSSRYDFFDDVPVLSLSLWKLLLPLLIISNAAYFLHNIIGWIIVLGFFLFVPGYIFLKTFRKRSWEYWEILSFSHGISILLLMITGLGVNSLGYMGIDYPLRAEYIFLGLDIMVLVLLVITRKSKVHIPLYRKFNVRSLLPIVSLLILPLLAIGGAIRLNNGASSILTIILFIAIPLVFLFFLLHKRFAPSYPFVLFILALSVLFTISLRSTGISGHDIQREYSVFQLTMAHGLWDIATFRDPYNACLSITILPTMFAKMTGIADPYIYKVVFQIIAAIAIIPIYLFAKKARNTTEAFMIAFLFILFPTFINDMSMLNRQEIAFLFFSLIMLLMLMPLHSKIKGNMTVLLIVGMTLSHYSSSYVALGLMIIAWFISQIIKKTIKTSVSEHQISTFPILKLPIIALAFICIFIWNAQITKTTQGLNKTVEKTISGFTSGKESKAQDVKYSLFGGKTSDPQTMLNQYTESLTKDKVEVVYQKEDMIPYTALGSFINKYTSVKNLHTFIRSSTAKLLQILLVIGCFIMWWRLRKKPESPYEMYLLSLTGGSAIMLIAITVLPQLSVDYGALRLFQQLLIILAIPIIIALLWLVKIVAKESKKQYFIAGLVLSGLFLHISGAIPQLTGGYLAQLSLNSIGQQYDAYYITDGQHMASKWISDNNDGTAVGFDMYARLRFTNNDFANVIVTSSFQPSVKMYVFHYLKDDEFIMNVNSNLYYYKIKRKNAYENKIYDNQEGSIGKLREL